MDGSNPLAHKRPAAKRDVQPESLKDEVHNLLEESRMVLPGIQALFGFQLIAVFNDGFQRLSAALQLTHLVAIFAVAGAIALIMTPAAYHRIAERGDISRKLAELGSAMLAAAMLPFAFGMALDIFIIAQLILDNFVASSAVSALAILTFSGLWFVLPVVARLRRRRRAHG